MHETLLKDIKFNLDHFDRYGDTYFLAGWVFSQSGAIESITVEVPDEFKNETSHFETRHDVNKFYDLPENRLTGFKFILTPDKEFDVLQFRVKLTGQEESEVFATIKSRKPPQHNNVPSIGINNAFPGLVVVENFYSDPDKVREYAMSLEFNPHSQYHKGCRTEVKTIFDGTREFFESILKKKITHWEGHVYNGVFQYCIAEDPLVYHTDNQAYAAVVFLTPDAPVECGTSFFKSKHNGLMRYPTEQDCERLNQSEKELFKEMFGGNFYDKTRWELADTIGNVYNRMVIWDAKKVHAASAYFGNTLENSRLFHMFFFDAE